MTNQPYRYTIERECKIYDAHGDCVRIGPDADGLELIELRLLAYGDSITARIPMPREQAIAVANALLEYCNNPANFGEAS